MIKKKPPAGGFDFYAFRQGYAKCNPINYPLCGCASEVIQKNSPK